MSTVVGLVLARWDAFVNRFQSGRVQQYRRQPFEPKSRAVALFGSEPGAFAEDWADYGVSQLKGSGIQPKSELVDFDSDRNLETWQPDLTRPGLVSHGHVLNYSHRTDQRPPVGHSVTPLDKEITLNSVEPRKDFQALRDRHEPTPADQAALDLKRYPYDLSI